MILPICAPLSISRSLSYRGLRTAEAAAVIVDLGSSNRISLDKLKGIAKRVAVNWAAPWLCPDVAPPAA